jgi:beta-lactamase class D
MKLPLSLGFLPFLALPGLAGEDGLARHFEGRPGTLVVLDGASGRITRVDATRAAERFAPCSTFKIPNALIGIDSGAVRPADSTVAWDVERYPAQEHWPRSWRREHDLRSAIRNSVLWYFEDLATRIERETYRRRLQELDYGNADVSGAGAFWLSSTLRVSADEQVAFLRRLHAGEAGFSDEARRFVIEAIELERNEDGSSLLRGKTGACTLDDGSFVGWLVGWVERSDGVAYYALNIEGPTYREMAPHRARIVKAALRDLGYW